MSVTRRGRRRHAGGVAIAAAAVLATAGMALATAPKKGYSYTTTTASKVFVSFKVSTNGETVIDLSSGTPVKCSAGSGGFPAARKLGAGKISKKGTFKVVLKLYPPGPAGHKSDGTDTVTGKFLKGAKAKGTVKSHFDFSSFCKAIKVSYQATGAPAVG